MIKEHTLYQFDLKKQGGVAVETFLSPRKPKVHTRGFSNGVVHSGGTATTIGAKVTPSTTVPCNGVVDAVVKKLLEKPSGKADLSRNGFKRLRSRLLFKRISFWLDDYVEVDIGSPEPTDKVMLMGSSVDGAYDLCEINHHVRSTVSLVAMGLKEKELMGNIQFDGEIYDTEYDKDMKAAIIRVRNLSVKEISSVH